ncbi:MAG: PLP-dependent aminotransferase family protein [Parvibaculaceae bacterium]
MTLGFRLDNLSVDRGSAVNLDRQIYLGLRDLIERRRLGPGTALPSTRMLARDLGLGRNTVIAAYEQLALEGFVTTARGTAPVVKGLPAAPMAPRPESPKGGGALSQRGRVMSGQPFHHGEPGVTAFHPGLPDADNFPFNTWSKLVARRTKAARADLFGSYHIMGHPPLCEAIARYLTASRGVACSPEQVVITTGAQAAFDLLARLLTDPGDTVWMEEPGYYGAGAAFLSAGAKLEPLRVTDQGWDFTPPPARPRVIFVTPSCHHPLGLTMTAAQRRDLIRMAAEWGAWIVEDDYDSEYRFQGQPIPALQGTVPPAARAIFVGTFAKILFPAMRLGYMVVPMDVRDRLTAALNATGQHAPLITQAALADFIGEGHLTRHLRRMRRLYAERRLVFMEQFDRHLGQWMELRRTDSGIQLVGLLRDQSRNDAAIARAAKAQGVNVSPLSLQYRFEPKLKGLLMGFAAADAKATRRAIEKLARVVRS